MFIDKAYCRLFETDLEVMQEEGRNQVRVHAQEQEQGQDIVQDTKQGSESREEKEDTPHKKNAMKALACGYDHSAVLTAAGQAYFFGRN